MSTHDADKTNSNPVDRRTMTRDPNATGGPLVESGESDKNGNPISVAGSVAATTNIDGKWYVCNIRGELTFGDKAYDTESEAVDAAQKLNKPEAVDAQHKEKEPVKATGKNKKSDD